MVARFFSPGPEAHRASCAVNAASLSSVVKRPGCGLDHPPHVAPRFKKENSRNFTPPLGLRGMFWGELYFHLVISVSVFLSGLSNLVI